MSNCHLLRPSLLNAFGGSVTDHHLNSLNIKVGMSIDYNGGRFNGVKFNYCISPRESAHLVTENIHLGHRSVFGEDGIQLEFIRSSLSYVRFISRDAQTLQQADFRRRLRELEQETLGVHTRLSSGLMTPQTRQTLSRVVELALIGD